MYILIQGNPVEGFVYTGPFETREDVISAAEDNGGDWWITQLVSPSASRQPRTKSDVVRELANTLGMECVDFIMPDVQPDSVIGFPIPKVPPHA